MQGVPFAKARGEFVVDVVGYEAHGPEGVGEGVDDIHGEVGRVAVGVVVAELGVEGA